MSQKQLFCLSRAEGGWATWMGKSRNLLWQVRQSDYAVIRWLLQFMQPHQQRYLENHRHKLEWHHQTNFNIANAIFLFSWRGTVVRQNEKTVGDSNMRSIDCSKIFKYIATVMLQDNKIIAKKWILEFVVGFETDLKWTRGQVCL